MTAALFARKGEATAEGFEQPPLPPRHGFAPRIRRAVLVLALPVAYLGAATLAVVLLEMHGDSPPRAVPEPVGPVAAPPTLPSPIVVAAGPASAAPATPKLPSSPSPRPSAQDAAPPPVTPVAAAFGVPPAPPLKPLTVVVAGTPGQKIGQPPASPGAGGRYRVQLASLGSAEAVRREWVRLKSTHGMAFRGLRLMVEASPSGAFYRLQAGPVASLSAARKLCAKLRRSRAGCLVVAR